MLTINTILKEIKEIPIEKLDDVFQFIHSLKDNNLNTKTKQNKILSFAGIFENMNKEDYKDFSKFIKKNRKDIFKRNINL